MLLSVYNKCPSTGECQVQEAGVGGLGNRLVEGIGEFQNSNYLIKKEKKRKKEVWEN